jgi:CRP/FNR family transcriptional regulator
MCSICVSYEELLAQFRPAQLVHFGNGAVIFKEGDDITGVYCLHRGTVAIHKRERITGSTMTYLATAGDLLGMPGIMTGTVYAHSAVAMGEVEVRFIPRGVFLELIRRQPQLIAQSMQRLCERIGFLEEHLVWVQGESGTTA